MTALKDKAGKPALTEFPLSAMEAGMRAFEYGKEKYARFDWLQGHSANDLVSAIIRHAMALAWTSETASDSTLHHMDHILADAAMYVEQARRGTLKRDLLTQQEEQIVDPHIKGQDVQRALAAHEVLNPKLLCEDCDKPYYVNHRCDLLIMTKPDYKGKCAECGYSSQSGFLHFESCSNHQGNYT